MCVLHSPSAVRLPVRISGRLNGTALQIQIDKFKIIVLVFFFEWSCLFWDLFLHQCAGNRSGRLLSYRGFRLRDTGSPPSCLLIRRIFQRRLQAGKDKGTQKDPGEKMD